MASTCIEFRTVAGHILYVAADKIAAVGEAGNESNQCIVYLSTAEFWKVEGTAAEVSGRVWDKRIISRPQ